MRVITARIIATALFTGLASMAGAAIVVDNGTPNQTAGSDMNAFLEAENFTLAAPSTTVNLLRFWSLQSSVSDYAGSIEWSIRLDGAILPDGTSGSIGLRSPGGIVASGVGTPTGVATGNSASGLDEYRYEFAINAVLAAGNYWLVLHNGDSASPLATQFYWAWSSDSGDSESLELALGGGAVWTSNIAELAFQLEAPDGGVPEPASVVLVGAGVAAVILRRRYQEGRAA